MRVAKAAATNSNRGIVKDPLIGQTLHLPNRNITDTVSSLYVNLPKQVTAYASWLESTKTCIYASFFTIHRGKYQNSK